MNFLCCTAQFPGDCHCCLIKVGLFHRQSEVSEGASKRPDERTNSSGEKLLPFFSCFATLIRIPTSVLLHLSFSHSLSLWLSLRTLQAHCQPLFTELILGWLSEDCFLLLPLTLSDISNFYSLVFYLLSSLSNYAIFASASSLTWWKVELSPCLLSFKKTIQNSGYITDQNANTLFSCVKRSRARIWGSFDLKIFWQLLQQQFLWPQI